MVKRDIDAKLQDWNSSTSFTRKVRYNENLQEHLQEQDVLKFSSSIAYSQRDTFQVNLHVICLVKSVMKEHLPMSSNLSNDTAIFKADQDCIPAFVSRQVPAGSATTCLLPPPFLFRGRIRGYRKKPWPCVRSSPLKKCTFRRLVGKKFINASCTYTHGIRRISVFQDPGRW